MFREPPRWGATAAIAGLPHPFAFNIALKEQKAIAESEIEERKAAM